jgi:hypothetical protein
MKKAAFKVKRSQSGIESNNVFLKLAFGWKAAFVALLALLGSLSQAAHCESTDPADRLPLNVILGDPQIQRQAEFRIPRRYDPEISDGYRFRLVVDYYSMQSVARPRNFRLNSNLLDIQVEAYPKYGTMADRVIEGTFGAKKIGEKNGYAMYSQPLGKTSAPTKVFAYVDTQGNNVIIEDPGEWSVRYRMTHGVKPYYVVTCFFSKKIGIDFREIDKVTENLVSGMYVK